MSLTKTKTKVRPFLVLCNVHRRFVQFFPSIVESLNKQLKTTASKVLTLTDDQMEILEALKNRLTIPSILVLPSTDKPYMRDADYNAEHRGCVLLEYKGV